MKDKLLEYSSIIQFDEILKLRQRAQIEQSRENWATTQQLLEQLEASIRPAKITGRLSIEVDQPIVTVNDGSGELPTALLTQLIQSLIPWRKGPFNLCGIEIDTEWRSDMKWSRIAAAVGNLTGKRVADIGCSNGYYMFRASARNPDLIVGLEPSEAFWYQFQMVQSLIRHDALCFEPYGVENINLYPNFFDLVLCMGILYHQQNPVQTLKQIRSSLAPGGALIVEGQSIPGDDSVALFVPDRYAKARNVYFIPTTECLKSWLIRAGYVDLEVISETRLTTDEQRKTALAPYESLADFLDPNDPTKTVEGYPAPWRVAIKAHRG